MDILATMALDDVKGNEEYKLKDGWAHNVADFGHSSWYNPNAK